MTYQGVNWEPVTERWTAYPEKHIRLDVEFDTNYRWAWEVKDDRLPTPKRRVARGYATSSDEAKAAAARAWQEYASKET